MRGDWEALSQIAEVVWHSTDIGPGWRRVQGPTGWIPDGRVLAAVRRADLVYQWFATPCAPVLAARLLGRPSIVVAGGYDVAAVPEIGYGRMLHRRTRVMGQLALVGASRVLAGSWATLREVLRWAPRTRVLLAYHGVEPRWYAPAALKRRQAITIGTVSEDYVRRKGLDTFARTSRLLPEIPFLLAGRHAQSCAVNRLRELGGPNLVLTGYLPADRLRALLGESAVYAQLSLHEGFGYAVAEAMLSRCHPVVTGRGALPEVVGELGLEVEAGDAESAARAIRLALSREAGPELRERIVRLFSPAQRAGLLQAQVQQLVGVP